jgi:hypothetical protein
MRQLKNHRVGVRGVVYLFQTAACPDLLVAREDGSEARSIVRGIV